MEQRKVAISYRRQVSDGNYGTEAAEVYLEWFLDADNDSHTDLEFAQEMLASAHDLVDNRLQNSQSPGVRRSVQPRTTAPTRVAATTPAGDEELPF